MPESVTVPDVLKGHAAEIWRAAFLSAYDGTCKERGDQRESCAASIAWSAVKNKYRKDDQGEWVERESPAAIIDTVPVEDTPKALDRVDPNAVKSADWLEAFIYALSGPCATSETPIACAVAFADARFPRDPAGEPEVQDVTAEVAGQVEAVSRSEGVHPNDYGDLSLPLVLRKGYSPEKRAEFAKQGWAMQDGSYPIADKGDLMDAIHSFVRVSEGSRPRVKAHITKRARELGATTQVSSEWGGKSDKAEVKSTTALSERALLRAKEAEADARLLASPEADKVIVRPSHMGSNEWMARPLALRTLRAQIVERSIQRSYDDAVEMTTAEGWQPITNPTRSGEFIFQRWLDTPDGQLLQRAILVRRSGTFEWRMRELTRGASLSLAVQVPADERRYGDDRPFELMTRGGPGSGHYGHEGRPGQRGGSAPGDEGGATEAPKGSGAPSFHPHKGGPGIRDDSKVGSRETSISEGRRVADYTGDDWKASVNKLAALPLEDLRHRQDLNKEQLATWAANPAQFGDKAGRELDMIQVMLAQAVDKREFGGEPEMPDRFVQEQMAVNPPTAEETKQQEEYEASKEVGREEAHAALAAGEEAQRQAFESGKMDEEGTTISNAQLPIYEKGSEAPRPSLSDSKGAVKEWLAANGIDGMKITGQTVGFSDLARESVPFVSVKGWTPELGPEKADALEKYAADHGFRVQIKSMSDSPLTISREQAKSLLERSFGKVLDR
jgi:cation transport regulator